MPWLTNKETGGHFNTDWLEEDRRKETQIANNKREADKLNGKSFDYSTLEGDPNNMAMELYKRTGINMTGNIRMVDDKTMVQVCTTLEDLQGKYHINMVSDPNSTDNRRLEVRVPNYYDHRFEGENDNVFAQADLCKVELNSKYYSLTPQEFDEVYAEGTQGLRPFHPKGTTSKDILAHECAHHMLDSYVWEHCKGNITKYEECQKWLTTGEYHNPEDPNKTVYNLDDKFKQIESQVKDNPEFQKFWGGRCGLNLLGIANPEQCGGKWSISKYASKNRHELVAEAFADFYANGENASELSKIIVFTIFGFKS